MRGAGRCAPQKSCGIATQMGATPRLGLVLLAWGILFSVACGSDDDDESGATQDCRQFPDPCVRCSCQVCPCDRACQQGLEGYQQCIDGCFSRDGGEAVLACMEDCEARTTGTARANLTCTESAVANQCAAACD
jgi:hypothetical protein